MKRKALMVFIAFATISAHAMDDNEPGLCDKALAGDPTSGCVVAAAGGIGGGVAAYKLASVASDKFSAASLTQSTNSKTVLDLVSNPETIDARIISKVRANTTDGDMTEMKVLLSEAESRKVLVDEVLSKVESEKSMQTIYKQNASDALNSTRLEDIRDRFGIPMKDKDGNPMKIRVQYQDFATHDAEMEKFKESVRKQVQLEQRAEDLRRGAKINLVSVTHRMEGESAASVADKLAYESRRGSKIIRVTNLPSKFLKEVKSLNFKGGTFVALSTTAAVAGVATVVYGVTKAVDEKEEKFKETYGYSPSRRSYHYGSQ